MTKKSFLLLTISILFLLGSVLFFYQNQKELSSQTLVIPLESITIAHPSHAGAGLIYLAQDKGFFRQEGLDVTLLPFTSGKDALTAVDEGRADFATTAETPFVIDVLRDSQIYLIATILVSEGDFQIIARKDRGISSPANLEGKKLGVNPGTVGEFVMDTFFVNYSLDNNALQKVYLKHEEMPGALASGMVDAVMTRYPHTNNAQNLLGTNAIIFSTKGIYKDLFNLVGTQSFVHAHQDVVKKMIVALINAENYIKENPSEAQKVIAKYANSNDTDIAAIWQNYDFQVRLDQSTLFVLEEEARWAIQNNLTTNNHGTNFLNYFYLDALQEVKPEAVTIIH